MKDLQLLTWLTQLGLSVVTPPILSVLLALWLQNHLAWQKKAVFSVVLLFLFVSVQLPFIIYNTRAKNRFTGPSTAADAVLALGNTPESPPGGRNAFLPAGPMEYPQSFHDFMANTAKGISVPRQMLHWMLKEPGAFFELQFRKLLLFWDGRELPNNVSLYGEGTYSVLLRLLIPGRSHFILTFALAGMLFFIPGIKRKEFRNRTLLYAFVILYWGAIAVFYILSRFRAPVIPLMTVFAGAFISTILLRWKKWDRHKKYLAVLAAASGCFLTVGAYDFYADNFEPAVMRLCRSKGTVLHNAVIDHGPFTCGAWQLAEITAGTRISKIFCAADTGKIQWTLQSQNSGTLFFKVNGTEMLKNLETGMNKIEFPASANTELEILSVPAGTAAVFDGRRDYGRSGLNGQKIPGEWIMRFYFR